MQEKTVTYQELARQAQKKEKHQIVLAIADGKIRELFQTAKEGEEISFSLMLPGCAAQSCF